MKTSDNKTAVMKDGTGIAHMLPENVEINLMYLMAYSLWFLADDAERRLKNKGQDFHHTQKQAFRRLMDALKTAKRQHDIMFEDYVSAWGNSVENYDGEQFNANLITRLLLLVYDRVLCNGAREEELFKLIRSYPQEDIGDDVLARFYMRK